MILNNVEKDKNQILKEGVDFLDVVRANFDKYKTEKFSSLEAAVIDYIRNKSKDEKSESIRKINQGLWVDTGANFIFDENVYRRGKQENDEKGSRRYIDISQLYHKNSRGPTGGPTGGYATFFDADYRKEWEKNENSGPGNSINPRTPTSKNETLLDFYRRLSADSKLKFKGEEINFSFPKSVEKRKKSELTVEAVVELFKHVMADGEGSIYEKAKKEAEAAAKKSDEPEETQDTSRDTKKAGTKREPQAEPKKQPAPAATKESEKERKKIAQVARTIRGTCWFDFDPNTRGISSGTPIEIWEAAGANFEKWYKQIVELFNYEGASPQFNYKSNAAAQGRLKGAPSKLNDNKNQSISLDCLSVFMTKIADNFRGNGVIAMTQLARAKKTGGEEEIKKVSAGAKYFLSNRGTYKGSVAHRLEQILNTVIAIIPSFKNGQIQKAMRILESDAAENLKEEARKVIAYARRNEKAIEELARKAKARATAPAAGAAGAGAKAPAAPAAATAPAATAGAPAKPTTRKQKGTTKENPFTLRELDQFHKSTDNPAGKKKRANRSYFLKIPKGVFKYGYDEQGNLISTDGEKVDESLKQKREKLLHEAVFKKLVR